MFESGRAALGCPAAAVQVGHFQAEVGQALAQCGQFLVHLAQGCLFLCPHPGAHCLLAEGDITPIYAPQLGTEKAFYDPAGNNFYLGFRTLGARGAFGGEIAFVGLLGFVGLSGLVLYALGQTPAMPALLAIHLGAVLGFFLLMPFTKMAHGFYRLAALAVDAQRG